MNASRLHAVATAAWAASIIPTMIWWRDSVLWIAMISVYANVVSHLTAYEAAQAKELAQSQAE